jgi:peptidoglycan/xylan/chitin deacetylase (PgdA/CDA1 family)
MKTLQKRRPKRSESALLLFHRLGLFDVARKLTPNLLTALNYHRIDDPFGHGFDTFRPNVSATPSDFAAQMDYVSQKYNVISGTELVAFIKGERQLPARAAIITFDDGYYDNYANAYPILKARNLRAIIFLATDFIGSRKPFFWDLIAYCFFHTKKEHAHLPHLGPQSWVDASTRDIVMQQLIEALKRMPDTEKQKLIAQLPSILRVDLPDDAFKNLMMSWSDARELSENGIELGAHTASHPILTRISLDEASAELLQSKRHIEEQIGEPVLSFAYPNGQAADFNAELMNRVHRAGFEIAFTLLPGPTQRATVIKNPLTIRRIFLRYTDSFPRFAAKLGGLDRIPGR